MRIVTAARTLTAGLVLASAITAAGASAAQTDYRIDRESKAGFEETVQRVEASIKSRGMMITGEVDHQNMLRMVGGSIQGAKTIEFGKPDMMKAVLGKAPEVGLEMPLRFYVFQRSDGKTVVSYHRASRDFDAYKDPGLKKLGGDVEGLLGTIADEATK